MAQHFIQKNSECPDSAICRGLDSAGGVIESERDDRSAPLC